MLAKFVTESKLSKTMTNIKIEPINCKLYI